LNVTDRLATRLIPLLLLILLVVGIKVFGTRVLHRETVPEASYVFDGFAMGTVLTVKVLTHDEKLAEKAADKALAEVRRLHKMFDPNDPESELSFLNKAAGSPEPLPVSADMSRVLRAALRIRKLSGGVFEPAMGKLIALWGFNAERKNLQVPDSSRISAIVESTHWGREIVITAGGDSVKIGEHAGSLDMGGIAKGYAVDRAIAVLASCGVRKALVNLGGEIGVLGVGSNGRSWRVGVQHPRVNSRHIGVIDLTEGFYVATSGDYERYFILGNRRYHHILNPATGYPAARGVLSVTVIASSCMEADGMATAAFVMGADRGIEYLEQSGAKGLILYAEDGETESGNFTYAATGSFLELMKPDLAGQLIP